MRIDLSIALAAALVVAGCSGSPGGPAPVPECQANLLECGGSCVDPQNDPQHCGACDTACAAGEFCQAGACVAGATIGCPAGQILCGESCVDPNTDRNHCGAAGDCQGDFAGTACPDGFVCDGAGTCALSCQQGLVACDGTCVDPAHSNQFCGATGDCQGPNAGIVCESGTTCSGSGTCVPSCPAGMEICGGACTAIAIDNQNCGGCGIACDLTQQCTDGMCCAPGQRVCNGQCVDVLTDEANCGACGNTCGNLAFCGDGACTCPAFANEQCPGAEDQCINFLIDPQNCGACGQACATGEFCVYGECSPTDDQWIGALTADNCTVAELDFIAGDDRGGVAVSGDYAFAIGDDGTARFASADLTGGASFPLAGQNLPTDGLFSDPSTGALYSLGIGDAPLVDFDDPLGETLDALFVVDPDTGTLVQRLALTPAIPLTDYGYGLFPGAGRLYLLYVDGGGMQPLYEIDLLTGAVTVQQVGTAGVCAYATENWALWGVAERIDGVTYLTYRDCSSESFVRFNTQDGSTTLVTDFFPASISDLASFTIAPTTNRWYFHHEGSSAAFGGLDETFGFCDATICSDSRCTP